VKGRGMAITGIILGLLFSLVSIGVAATSWWGVGKLKGVAGDATRTYISSIADGDLTTAAANSSMTPTQQDELREKIKDWGKVTAVNMNLTGMSAQNTNGRSTIEMRGTATFDKAGDKGFRVFLDDGGAGKLKVVDLKFD